MEYRLVANNQRLVDVVFTQAEEFRLNTVPSFFFLHIQPSLKIDTKSLNVQVV